MKVTKILPTNIPRSHYKWAGIEEEKEKKNDLDVKKLDELVRRAYDKKYGTYNRKGEFVVYEEAEVQDRDTSET
tara:strand:+ start:180 stop:401 length:222 start_codon:yes stop_codon:yes gene_type:complete